MVRKYHIKVQPLVLLEITYIPERRFGWRSSSELGMPRVWLEGGLAQTFQVSAGANLELTLIDAAAKRLIDRARVRLADEYTTMYPTMQGKRQDEPALLEIGDALKNDGLHPYSATLRVLGTPAPVVYKKPTSSSGNSRPPKNTYMAPDEDEGGRRRIIIPASR